MLTLVRGVSEALLGCEANERGHIQYPLAHPSSVALIFNMAKKAALAVAKAAKKNQAAAVKAETKKATKKVSKIAYTLPFKGSKY